MKDHHCYCTPYTYLIFRCILVCFLQAYCSAFGYKTQAMAPFSESRSFGSWWAAKTSLEQKLIVLSSVLFLLSFCLLISVIVISNRKPSGGNTPTVTPTGQTEPTEIPTEPTEKPTVPTEKPTVPTENPTVPTEKPTVPTEKPTEPTDKPIVPKDKKINDSIEKKTTEPEEITDANPQVTDVTTDKNSKIEKDNEKSELVKEISPLLSAIFSKNFFKSQTL